MLNHQRDPRPYGVLTLVLVASLCFGAGLFVGHQYGVWDTMRTAYEIVLAQEARHRHALDQVADTMTVLWQRAQACRAF